MSAIEWYPYATPRLQPVGSPVGGPPPVEPAPLLPPVWEPPVVMPLPAPGPLPLLLALAPPAPEDTSPSLPLEPHPVAKESNAVAANVGHRVCAAGMGMSSPLPCDSLGEAHRAERRSYRGKSRSGP